MADVQNGTFPRAVVNTMVQRILTEMFRFNLFKNPPTGTTSAPVTTPATWRCPTTSPRRARRF